MNNEIKRKITSLTLMTIMLAGGMTFAIPGMVPAAHAANANLFVSAENSQFDNYMAGPMVIEVIVIDSDRSDTSEGEGAPDVTVQGKDIIMTQATDGSWYGYFADNDSALAADATQGHSSGQGLDFGTGCTADTAHEFGGVSFTDTVGVFFPVDQANDVGMIYNSTMLANCAGTLVASENPVHKMNVIRESKAINTNAPGTTDNLGQIGLAANAFPMIQLYDLNPTGNVVITYNKGGGAQSTTLTFNTVDQFASLESDRTEFPRGSQVHLTLTDVQLNIDPTDEDSWTWGTGDGTVAYQVFDENGAVAADDKMTTHIGGQPVTAAVNLAPILKSDFMFEDNGILRIDLDANNKGEEVLRIIDNDDSITTGTMAINASDVTTGPYGDDGNSPFIAGTQPVTFTETEANKGIFVNYDESDRSNLIITNNASRGISASIDYNQTPKTILVGFGFATIDIQATDDEWNSGEEIPIVLVDTDANLNSRAEEDLNLFDPSIPLIPSLSTGDPFTLGETGTGDETKERAIFLNVDQTLSFDTDAKNPNNGITGNSALVVVDKFSQRAILDVNATAMNNQVLIIDLGVRADELFASISNTTDTDVHGFNLFNMDLRSIAPTGTYAISLLNTSDTDRIITENLVGNIVVGSNHTLAGNITSTVIVPTADVQSLTLIEQAVIDMIVKINPRDHIGLMFSSTGVFDTDVEVNEAIVADFFTFGFNADGDESGERVANQIIRIEVEETGDNTNTFAGSLEYTMLNQINILNEETYEGLSTIADDPSFIVIEDLTDEDSPRVNYLDLGSDGVSTQIADQQEAPSHSGIVSFDSESYKTADTVTITLEDLDLNTDSDLIDIYTVVVSTDPHVGDQVGAVTQLTDLSFGDLGRILDITYNDGLWTTPDAGTCWSGDEVGEGTALEAATSDTGLGATGFTLAETSKDSGTFTGTFQIPPVFCPEDTFQTESVTGLDIEVNYVDFRDASGEIIEVGDSAGVRANTGSVSLDRTVYPVPFGIPEDFRTITDSIAPEGRSIFPVHDSGIDQNDPTAAQRGIDDASGEFLANGDLTIHIRVNDPDFDISASGEDSIAEDTADEAVGPIKISIIRGSDIVVLGYAGNSAPVDGLIDVGDDGSTEGPTTDTSFFGIDTTPIDMIDENNITNELTIRQLGPLLEIAPDAGIFELDFDIRYTDGPASTTCPNTNEYTSINGETGKGLGNRFSAAPVRGADYCILQGDILQVEYTDPADASGDPNTVTDSATFDLRNGVLQSDKSVYIIGSDMILTLIEPDLDLDNDGAETYDLDLIEWDSSADTTTMGNLGGQANAAAFDPEPSNFRETGDSTGIFQVVIEIPAELDNESLDRGEEIILEYTDWGPSGSDYVGDEDEDVRLTVFTSNFGATIALDQKVYTWTDKVYITITAPDHNFDGDLVDEIGEDNTDPIKISTRGFDIDNYKLVETGTDTGIFTGEVILTGFLHDADGDGEIDTNPRTSEDRSGPTNGFLQSEEDDGLSISFEFSTDETVVGSSLIRWNVGEVQWLEASYPASGTGVVRVIDPDMNLDPEAVDNFDVDIWSDSDSGGIDLTITETNEATGIFEGTVFYTITDESSGHRLRVAEGDTVTARYEDNTLPAPFDESDELKVTSTTLIGTIVPPLERAPAANLRVVDSFGNSLDSVSVDQQVQISADFVNGQDKAQLFAYLVQVQDGDGVTVSLDWIKGELVAAQSLSPASSWNPTQAGTYTITAFVWESLENPTALSPPVITTVTVQ